MAERSEQSERSEPPKFGNWENGENVEYTDYFEKAGKGRSGAKRKPNDPKEKYSNSTQSEEPSGQKLPEVVSSENESHIDNSHHRHGGVRPRSSKSDTPKGPVDTLKSSREEGDMKRANDSPLRHDTVSRKATNVNSPHHRHGGLSTADGSKRTTRQSTGIDRSIEQSPLHPNHQARIVNKGSGVSSPSWERKGSAEGSHGVPPTTPGRSRLRSGNRGDETTDEGPTVPKFGDWDENDPTSAEGFTQTFELVRDEKNSAGKAPLTSNASSSYPNGQNRRGNESSKGCLCFPWGRK